MKKTIEEVADKWFQACGKNIYYDYDSRFAFIAGAKYQSEQIVQEIERRQQLIISEPDGV